MRKRDDFLSANAAERPIGREQVHGGAFPQGHAEHDLGIDQHAPDRLGLERQRHVGRRRGGRRRHQADESIQRLRHQLGGRAHVGQLLAERGHRGQQVPHQDRGPDGGCGVAGSRRLPERGELLLNGRRPGRRPHGESGNRIAQPSGVVRLGCQTGALEKDDRVVRHECDESIEQPQGLGIGVRTRGTLDLFGQRESHAESLGILIDGAAELRDPLVEPAACDLRARRQQQQRGVIRRQREGAHDGIRRGIELTEPKLRHREVGPRRRLLRHELRRSRELRPRVVQEPHFERGEPVIEGTRDLFVGLGPGLWKRTRPLPTREHDEYDQGCRADQHEEETLHSQVSS